jgi:L-fuconolactonase
MRRIDSHQHFWRLSRGDYDWLTPDLGPDLAPLYRDFEPADLAPHLAAHGIGASVVVQAAETDAETDFLLGLAASTPWIAAVVGWTDLEAPGAAGRIAALVGNPALVGLRPMLQDMADDGYILRPSVQPALEAMRLAGLRLDALVRPRHLPCLVELRQRFPDLPMVVDHGAKPGIAEGALQPWATALRAVAADGVTCCKLSGLVTEAGADWTVERLKPFVDVILSAFGPARVMWGSDWPVLTLAADYGGWAQATDRLLSGLSAAERADVLGGTAARFYGLEA